MALGGGGGTTNALDSNAHGRACEAMLLTVPDGWGGNFFNSWDALLPPAIPSVPFFPVLAPRTFRGGATNS